MLTLTPPVIAIYGGAFDPPQIGHVEIVKKLYGLSDIQTVIVIPSKSPPHKTPVASLDHRIDMCSAALFCGSGPVVSQMEKSLPGNTYTVDVMKTLPGYGEYPYALVLGTDEVRYLPKWKNPEELFENVGLIIVSRPGSELTEEEKDGNFPVGATVRKRIQEAPVVDLRIVVSSSEIRRMIVEGNPMWKNLVPKVVEAYIKAYGLYGCKERSD